MNFSRLALAGCFLAIFQTGAGAQKIMAHRGAWHAAPENSLSAIAAAERIGAELVEIDIRRTADGVLVLMHDETVDRTTDGAGRIDEMAWADARALRLLGPDGKPTDERIPMLEEALATTGGSLLVLDVKGQELYGPISELLAKTGAGPRTVTMCRGPLERQIEIARELPEGARFLFSVGFGGDSADAVIRATLEGIAAAKPFAVELLAGGDVTDEQIAEFARALRAVGVEPFANTLDTTVFAGRFSDARAVSEPAAVWGAMADLGIGIIQTDHPEELRRFLDGRSP